MAENGEIEREDADEAAAEEDGPPSRRDFSQAIADLKNEAESKQTESRTHMSRGMRAAAIAVAALLLIVVGGENVLRRGLDSLVPTPMQKAALAAEEKAAAAARVLREKSETARRLERSMRELQVRADTLKSLQIARREAETDERALTEAEFVQRDKLIFEARGLEKADKELVDGRKASQQLETVTARLKKNLETSSNAATQAELRADEAAKDLNLAEVRLRDLETQLAETRGSVEQSTDTARQTADLVDKSSGGLAAAQRAYDRALSNRQKLRAELGRLKSDLKKEGPFGKARIAAEITAVAAKADQLAAQVSKTKQELAYRQKEQEARARRAEEAQLRSRNLADDASKLEERLTEARSDLEHI